MLSNQVIRKVIRDMRRISGLGISVWDAHGECLAFTESFAEQTGEKVQSFLEDGVPAGLTEEIDDQNGVFAVYEEEKLVYVLAVSGQGADLALTGRLGVSQIERLQEAYENQMDKNRFVQNLLLDNMLTVDIYNQAKKMRIPDDQRRVVFVIEPKNEGENLVLETLQGIFEADTMDFVTAVDEYHVILVKALENGEGYPEVSHMGEMIRDTLNMEAMVGVRLAYGTIVRDLKEVSRSYKEAGMALEVGRVFYQEKNILAYNQLGIGRLIHQLSQPLCEMFLKEVLGGKEASVLFDEEELMTAYTFFDNNLNVSETARKLFIHRNTLVYRLEKIQKKTGLDVRVFEDALTFKIAVMVERHLKFIGGR